MTEHKNENTGSCCASTSDGGTQTATSEPRMPSPAVETPSTTGRQDPAVPGTTSTSAAAPPSSSSSVEPTTAPTGGDGPPSYIPKDVKGAKAFLPATAQTSNNDVSKPAPVPTSQSSGPKAVRGWAPPTKEWDEDTGKKKTDQTRFEIKEEWDEDGNLVRTTIKKTITPDWKTKIEKTIDIIPAAEAAKMKKK